jgi:hypothetical protein
MKYTLTFPNPCHALRVDLVRILRQLSPGLGLKSALDIVDQGGTQVMDFVSTPEWPRRELLSELSRFGVEVTVMNEPEVPTWRPVMTDTLADLRNVAIAAMDRGEHDIAIALIELIKKNS